MRHSHIGIYKWSPTHVSDAMHERLVDRVQEAVRSIDGLLNTETYPLDHELAGHCYVASEALFHCTGGYDEWQVHRCKVTVMEPLGGTAEFTHWFLVHRDDGTIVDPTSEQFTEYKHDDVEIPYDESTATGFMTEEPSKRCQKVISELAENTK